MPKVKASAFLCPQCGSPTRVLRTRSALPQRLVRYRICESGHRLKTREAIEVVPMRLALQNLCDSVTTTNAKPHGSSD